MVRDIYLIDCVQGRKDEVPKVPLTLLGRGGGEEFEEKIVNA